MTRFPMAVMCLRCMNQWSQADWEFQGWFERTVDLIVRGEAACVRPNWERSRVDIWLGAGDPA